MRQSIEPNATVDCGEQRKRKRKRKRKINCPMLTPAHNETELELLYPLTLFRRKGGGPLPQYELVDGGEMPDPYRKLLVHNGDMTSRLEAFHGGSIVPQ